MGSNEVNLYVVFNNMGSLQYMSHIPCLISSPTPRMFDTVPLVWIRNPAPLSNWIYNSQ